MASTYEAILKCPVLVKVINPHIYFLWLYYTIFSVDGAPPSVKKVVVVKKVIKKASEPEVPAEGQFLLSEPCFQIFCFYLL